MSQPASVSIQSPGPNDIVKCYGKRRSKEGSDECDKRSVCAWGEACKSASNEEADDIHYHKANVSVGFMLYDPNDDGGDAGLSDCSEADANEIFDAIVHRRALQSQGRVVGGMKLTPDEYTLVCRVVEGIAKAYFDAPTAFECLMKKVCKGKNQSDVAKEKEITRQGLNKRLLFELGIAQKRNDIQARRDNELAQQKIRLELAEEQARSTVEAFKSMTKVEYAIYKVCAEDGSLSISALSEITGFTRKTIQLGIQNLATKYAISIQLAPYKRRKLAVIKRHYGKKDLHTP